MKRLGWMGLWVALVLGAAGGTTGCDTDSTALDCLCTEEFRSFTVTVIDGAGVPVEGMSLTVTRTRDGFEYPVGQDLGFAAGTPVRLAQKLSQLRHRLVDGVCRRAYEARHPLAWREMGH